MYAGTCKTYIVNKVHLNTGDNWHKQTKLDMSNVNCQMSFKCFLYKFAQVYQRCLICSL